MEIDWWEGDAEDLPFEDGRFDIVLSAFGCMFAALHAVVASEIVRVLRPGGRIGLLCWTPGGNIGEFFRIVSDHAPPPPAAVDPPLLWGEQEHVRALFEGSGVDLEFEHAEIGLRNDSVPGAVELYSTKLGPVARVRQLLEAQHRWPALRNDLMHLFARHNTATDGRMVYPAQYLVVLGCKPVRS